MAVLANEVVHELRSRCCEATKGLTCSAGIGPNQMLAKIASDFNKPNGQYYVGHDVTSIVDFMFALPMRKVPGVGKVTERILSEVLGVKTCQDMFSSRHRVYGTQLFSESTRDWLLSAALGIAKAIREDPTGQRHVGPKRKGISCERTFGTIKSVDEMLSWLKKITTKLGKDMLEYSLFARTFTLKIKTDDFEVVTRAKTIASFTADAEVMYKCAKMLMVKEFSATVRGRGVRLLGIRASGFRGASKKLGRGQQRLETAFMKNVPARSGSSSPLSIPHQKNVPSEEGKQDITSLFQPSSSVLSSSSSSSLSSLTGNKRKPEIHWSDVDQGVLAELPADIQAELKSALRPKKTKQRKKPTPSISSFFGKKM